MLFGTPFICHQWGSLSDMGTPPTWEKGSHLPPGTTKLGNLRDSGSLSQLPLLNQIFGILLCVKPTQGCQKCDRGSCTGTLGELVGSHTKVAILSHLRNLLQKVVIHAWLNTGLKGIQVVNYPTNSQTTKVMLTKVFPKILGACTWINKVHSSSRIYSCSTRGTDIARVRGLVT